MAAPAPGPLTLDGTDQAFVSSAISNATADPYKDVNVGFVLNSGYLVFFMHCGFAMLSIGSVRARFAKHIAILILVDACASALGYFLVGYAFAFGDNIDASGYNNGNPFIGTRFFALAGLPPSNFYLWLFQWSFAATACTIVSGAIAERARFETYVLYSLFMAAWVYPILTHSVWSSAGWASAFRTGPYLSSLLATSGVIDFAGSGAVHMVGGYAALTGCFILGPRIGRFLPDGTVVDMPGHNTSLFVLGVMILWFGWYGFNPGSQLALVGVSSAVANAAVTTTLAGASAGMSAMAIKYIVHAKRGSQTFDIMAMGNGVLCGLVAITSGCSVVYPWAAVIIGLVAGGLYILGSHVSIWARLDDPLDAIAVHAWGGTWGVFAVGLFAARKLVFQSYGANPRASDPSDPSYYRPYGVFEGDGGNLLAAQVIYMFWLVGWVVFNMFVFFYTLKKLGLFRVSPEVETVGLDDSYHGGSAYPGGPEEAWGSMHGGSGGKGLSNGGSDADRPVTQADLKALRAELKGDRLGRESTGHHQKAEKLQGVAV